jgi:hypothetical protein
MTSIHSEPSAFHPLQTDGPGAHTFTLSTLRRIENIFFGRVRQFACTRSAYLTSLINDRGPFRCATPPGLLTQSSVKYPIVSFALTVAGLQLAGMLEFQDTKDTKLGFLDRLLEVR